MNRLRHASLFSGIGGPEVAAAMLGWENVFHCEINPFGRAVLDYWFPNSRSYDDITKTDFKQYRGQIDVLTGGFPCQPFSYAGKRGGQTDDRYLWPEMLRVIDEIRPTWVVGENVAGITTMVESCEITDLGGETSLFEEDNGVHRFRFEYTFTIERICRDLESKGYSVQPLLIPACAVGAPHRRDRVFIVAYSSRGGSESFSQNGGAEGHGSKEFSQPSKWREPSEFNNGLHSFSRFANNADCCDDLREAGEAGEDARKSRKERISERNEVWEPGEPSDVRSKGEESAENSMRDGLFSRLAEEQRDKRNEWNTCSRDNEWICGKERLDFADTDCNRGREVHQYLQSSESDGQKPLSNGGIRAASDTDCWRLERTSEGHRKGRGNNALWKDRSLLPGERWKEFPTVSAVHRGNDGFPFDVDNLTIPFAKWRNESLKAYGNAIVPQVMYRIFQCIEEAERL